MTHIQQQTEAWRLFTDPTWQHQTWSNQASGRVLNSKEWTFVEERCFMSDGCGLREMDGTDPNKRLWTIVKYTSPLKNEHAIPRLSLVRQKSHWMSTFSVKISNLAAFNQHLHGDTPSKVCISKFPLSDPIYCRLMKKLNLLSRIARNMIETR